MFWNILFEISLIVVSEKIITDNPIKKVKILILLYFKLSFEVRINIKGIKDKKGM